MGLLSASDREVKEQVEAEVVKFGEMGIRTLAVAKMEGHNGEWKMMGLLTFLDPPRPDTKQTIIDANKYGKKRVCPARHFSKLSPLYLNINHPSLNTISFFSGVNVKMITGDHLLIAKNTAKTLR